MRRIAWIINNGNTSDVNIVRTRDDINPKIENPFRFSLTRNDPSLTKSFEPDISAVPRMLIETVDVRVYQ